MKIRNGFVSNSSSSSFVLMVRKPRYCPICGRSDTNFIELVEKNVSGFSDNSVEARGIKNVSGINWYLDEESNRRFKNKLKNYKKQLEDSGEWEIVAVEISNHDNVLRNELEKGLDEESIIILLDQEQEG